MFGDVLKNNFKVPSHILPQQDDEASPSKKAKTFVLPESSPIDLAINVMAPPLAPVIPSELAQE